MVEFLTQVILVVIHQLMEGTNMRNTKIIIVALSLLLFTGCATTYQSHSFTGGYSETQLDYNVFKVQFSGNGYTGRQRTSDFCLLRCAELCKMSGYNYFVIVSGQEYTSHSSYTAPTRTTTTGRANVVGNTVYGSSSSTTTGGQTYNFAKPSNSNTIVCFTEKPEGFAYNADFLYNSISKQYNIVK